MSSYRIILWSTERGMSERRIADSDSAPLLDALDTIGRQVVHGTRPHPETCGPLPTPTVAHARRHLRIARRLLEEAGEHGAAARATLSLVEIRQR